MLEFCSQKTCRSARHLMWSVVLNVASSAAGTVLGRNLGNTGSVLQNYPYTKDVPTTVVDLPHSSPTRQAREEEYLPPPPVFSGLFSTNKPSSPWLRGECQWLVT